MTHVLRWTVHLPCCPDVSLNLDVVEVLSKLDTKEVKEVEELTEVELRDLVEFPVMSSCFRPSKTFL